MFLRTVELAFARFQAKGEAKALAIVFDRTASELLRVARHLAQRPQDAEDLVQATFLTAIEVAGTFQKGRPVLPWLLGILANHSREARRSSRRVIDPARIRGDVVADVEGEVEAAELQRELSLAIGGLPEVYRPVLRLWFEHGLEAHEIASTLERPAGTVRAQVSRGIEMLRQALPKGLVGVAAVSVVAGHGLASVRASVLSKCTGTSSGLASALAFGGLLMLHNKLTASGALAAIALFSWITFYSPTDTVPLLPEANTVQAAATGGIVEPVAPDNDEVGSSPTERALVTAPSGEPALREPVPQPSTQLLVHLRSSGDKTVLVGYGVSIRRSRDLANLARASAFVATDRDGVARFSGLEPDQYYIEIDRAGVGGVVVVLPDQVTEHTVMVPDAAVVDCLVVDPLGQPVAHADIVVQGSRLASPRVAVTDAAGRATVRHCNGVELQAHGLGFAPSLAHMVQGRPGQQIDIRLQLSAAGRRITGRAFDHEGEPVKGGVVAIVPVVAAQVTPWDRGKRQARPIWLRTDNSGAFSTDEVSDGQHLIVVRPKNIETTPSWGHADTRKGDAHVELRSQPSTVVEGSVHKDGKPVAGVMIRVWPEKCAAEIGYLLNLVGMRMAETDAEGAFRIVGTLPGELVISAYQSMESLGQVRRVVAAGERTQWDLEIGGGAELSIQIGCDGKLPQRLMAFVYDVAVPNQAAGMVPFTSKTATYRKPRTGAVSVVLAVLPGGRSIVQLARREVPASATTVDFQLAADQLPIRQIVGRLVDELMAPKAAETVSVRRTDGKGLAVVVEGVTAADGSFSLGPLPAGRYMVWAGEMRSGAMVGNVLLTAARDEDAGDLTVKPR